MEGHKSETPCFFLSIPTNRLLLSITILNDIVIIHTAV